MELKTLAKMKKDNTLLYHDNGKNKLFTICQD